MRRSLKGPIVALVLLALAVRLAAVALTPGYVPRHDDSDYDRHACWVQQHGFLPADVPPRVGPASCVPLRPPRGARHTTAYRPPLWPAVLGVTYALPRPAGMSRWTAGRIVQALIGTAIVALLGWIGWALCGRAVALVTLGLGALFAPLVLDGLSLISEPLFVALVLAAVAATLRARRAERHALRWAAGAGVLVGLASLARANGPVVALPLAVAVWTPGRRLAAPAVLLAAAALTIAPWTVRNAVVTHAFIPVSSSGGNTLIGTYNETARTRPGCVGCWTPPIDDPAAGRLVRAVRDLGPAQRDHRTRAAAIRFAREHPGYVLQVLVGNTRRLLELAGAPRTAITARTIDVSPTAARHARWELWAVLALALAGAVLGTLRRAPPFVLALFALLWLSTALIQSETPRFRAPLDPFLVLAAAAGAVALTRRLRRAA